MKIIFVHHAHRKKGNPKTQNDDITDIGFQDANLVAELLNIAKERDQIKAIYSSEFFRCTKTANIINKHINVPIIIDPRLNEHKSNLNETWTDTLTRTCESVKDIIKKHDDDDVVICVTSGLNISAFIALAFKTPINENTPMIRIPSCSPMIFTYKKQDFS